MGNICCKHEILREERPTNKKVNRITTDIEKSDAENSENTKVDPMELNIINLLGNNEIQAYIRELKQAIESDPVNDKKNILVEDKLKLFGSNYVFKASFVDLPSGYKMHNYLHEYEYPFTPEMFFLFSLQQDLARFSKIDDSLDSLETLHYSCVGNTIVVISETKSKKVLLIEPRSFLILRIIQKISKTEFIECQKSVQITKLKDQPIFAEKIKNLVNLSEMNIGGSWVKQTPKGCTETTLNKVDILSSTGAPILKPFLKKKFVQFYRNKTKETLKFILKTEQKDYCNLKWFTNDSRELDRIFEENREIVREKKLNLTEVDPNEGDDISKRISNLMESSLNKSRISDASFKEGSFQEKNIDSFIPVNDEQITNQDAAVDDITPVETAPVEQRNSQSALQTSNLETDQGKTAEEQNTEVEEKKVEAEQTPQPSSENKPINLESNQPVESESHPVQLEPAKPELVVEQPKTQHVEGEKDEKHNVKEDEPKKSDLAQVEGEMKEETHEEDKKNEEKQETQNKGGRRKKNKK